VTEAFLLSFKLATLTALTLLVLGLPLAYVLAFKRFPLKPLLETVLLLPLTLPPTVLGFYLLVLLHTLGEISFVLVLAVRTLEARWRSITGYGAR